MENGFPQILSFVQINGVHPSIRGWEVFLLQSVSQVHAILCPDSISARQESDVLVDTHLFFFGSLYFFLLWFTLFAPIVIYSE